MYLKDVKHTINGTLSRKKLKDRFTLRNMQLWHKFVTPASNDIYLMEVCMTHSWLVILPGSQGADAAYFIVPTVV